MLPACFQPEGSILPDHLLPHFEQYYRASLRRVPGSRVRARLVFEDYAGWAASVGAAHLTFKKLRRMMEVVGHRRIQSDGIFYGDLALARDVPGLADTLPQHLGAGKAAPLTSDAAAVVAKIDDALKSLLEARAAVLTFQDTRAPHEAAARVLGLLL